ncbi:MAG: VCBS repeat-containing protein [Nitrospira sp.]|nr:VCBS repeat-containing protein [Nitrospira sp.]
MQRTIQNWIKDHQLFILVLCVSVMEVLGHSAQAWAACEPAADQASFYTEANFRGTCVVRDVGDFPNAESSRLSNNSISSLKVGVNVQVVQTPVDVPQAVTAERRELPRVRAVVDPTKQHKVQQRNDALRAALPDLSPIQPPGSTWPEEGMIWTDQRWGGDEPRFVVDLTGDGRADIVGFGNNGVWTSVNNGGPFSQARKVLTSFNSQGWHTGRHLRLVVDLTNDGKADIIGFGDHGVGTAVSLGDGTFAWDKPVLFQFGVNQGWRVDQHPRFVADVTGDGKADLVGFWNDGVWIALGKGDGTFDKANLVLPQLGVNQGWRVEQHPRFVADVTGDGKADLVGFWNDGVWIAVSKGDGTFDKANLVLPQLGVDQGWRVEQHPRFVADVTGDGKADLVGFWNDGVWVAVSKGNGTFDKAKPVLAEFGINQGWGMNQHLRLLADLTGDGRADLVGFGDDGVKTAVSKGDGTFGELKVLPVTFSVKEGWEVGRHLRAMVDLNNDRKADIIGFGNDAGPWVALSNSDGMFQPAIFVDSASPVAACEPSSNQASFYTDVNFRGACVVRDVGEFSNAGAIGLPNDSISSIRVGIGAQVFACADEQFSVRCEVLTGSSASLGASAIGNDQITSFKVQPIGTPLPPCFPGPQQVGIYVHDNFSGACRLLSVGDYPTATSMELPNDSISSIRVGPGTEIHVCEHEFYDGKCTLLTSDSLFLGNTVVGNDSVTSARVRPQGQALCPTGDLQVTFFGDPNFTGPCSSLNIGEFPTATSTGLANDSISSFRLGLNVEVVVCEHEDFSGACQVFTHDIVDMNGQPVGNEKITSIRVRPRRPAPQAVVCPSDRQIVTIDSKDDLNKLLTAVGTPNAIVLLAASLDMDVSSLARKDEPVLRLARCVTMASYVPPLQQVSALPNSARSPNSPGPVLRMREQIEGTSLIEASCISGFDGDGARISGFRVFGPTFDDQQITNYGINIMGCHDVEISNMEVAGWGVAAISVNDPDAGPGIPDYDLDPIRVLIQDNYIHHNQRKSEGGTLDIGGHAFGYGVVTGPSSWSRIYQNVFDFNRHSVAANGHMGGYQAERNLILKGGGYHGTFWNRDTHVFDIHGTDGCNGGDKNCGAAGRTSLFRDNTFQYKKDTDIKIRGNPTNLVTIDHNIFVRSDRGAAIDLFQDCCTVKVLENNRYNMETYGRYGVCDLDGDGIDDLFLPTGVTWWSSSGGEYPWTYLKRDDSELSNLRLGYFDGTTRCGVMSDTGTGIWRMSSGGRDDWKELGKFGRPLSEVHFGRFDPNQRDHRPGIKKPETHAFWRDPEGQWFVTPLSHPDWQPVQSSSKAFSQLRFGDFNGDGVTDVLANIGGHWSVSDSAREGWRPLNVSLNDPVDDAGIFIANMDQDDNIDDILKLEVKNLTQGELAVRAFEVTWWRSKNGTEPWQVWKTYTTKFPNHNPDFEIPGHGMVGWFGPAGAFATLMIDENRIGHFQSVGQGGAPVEWRSLFPY